MSIFSEPGERAQAMGFFGFVCASGGSIGVLAGGFLTNSLNWHWVFLVNLPIGAVVYGLSLLLLPAGPGPSAATRLDVAGAITVTTSLMLAVYAIVDGNDAGWMSWQTIGLLGSAVLLLVLFLCIEARARDPLMPLAMLRLRNVATANLVSVLWAASMFAWFFISALYMQLVLGYSALQVGLAYLPANLIMAAFSLGLSARVVMRFGLRLPLLVGLLLTALGLVLFAQAPVDGVFGPDLLPAMVFLGLGIGFADNPLLLAAMGDVPPSESGLASGLVNTSFMMGGALGLAILASLAAARTESLLAAGVDSAAALTRGYHTAFGCAAAFAAASCLLVAAFLRTHSSKAAGVNVGSALPILEAAELAERLRVGDIVFIRIPVLPFRRVAAATNTWTNHVGVVVDVSGAEPSIAESKFPLSCTTALSRFIGRSEARRAAVARLKEPLSLQQQLAVAAAARKRTGIVYDTGFNLFSRRQFCSRFVREVVHEATGKLIGEVESFSGLFARNPQADLGFWRLWFFGRIPWNRQTVTPVSLLQSPHLVSVFDGTVR